jgi:polysaccharide export outer membrane protein
MDANIRRSFALALAGIAVLVTAVSAAAQVTTNYIVGPQDLLAITVWGEADLSGKFTVEADGSLSFPLIGRVPVGGLTVRGVEEAVAAKLAAGFLRTPQVSVVVEQYRSQRIYVVGEVRNPGPYPLTGQMTLMQALAGAGAATPEASGDVLIVRSREGQRPGGPILPGEQDAAEVVRVNLADLQSGIEPRHLTLRDSDTVYLPRAELVYVFGQVRTPGAYPLRKGTTVLQALSLAGGVADRGATGRIRIVRQQGDRKVEIRVRLDEAVEAGDTIVVPERFF